MNINVLKKNQLIYMRNYEPEYNLSNKAPQPHFVSDVPIRLLLIRLLLFYLSRKSIRRKNLTTVTSKISQV